MSDACSPVPLTLSRFERARQRFLESLQASRVGLMRPVPAAADKVLVPVVDAAMASEWRLCSPVPPFLSSEALAVELGLISGNGLSGVSGPASLAGWSGVVCVCVVYVFLCAYVTVCPSERVVGTV
jgi:hypothetical protein